MRTLGATRIVFTAGYFTNAAGEIGTVTQLPGGGLSFQFRGLAGRTYIIQASTDLVQWENLSTNVVVGGTIQFTDRDAPRFSQRFYRLTSE